MRRAALVLGLMLLVGCTSGTPKVPTVTFEAAGFLRAYLADRDSVIRQTAPAVKRCANVAAESSVELRRKCDELKKVKDEWEQRDAVVYNALMTGQTITSIDWEKAAGIAGTLIGAAAGIAL